MEVDARPAGPAAAVLAFTAHAVVVADAPVPWVASVLDPGDLGAAHSPAFLVALGERLGAEPGALDVVLAAPAVPAATDLDPVADLDHPRLARARRYRDDVRAWTTSDGAGLLVLGRGLAGRLETSFEVAPDARGRGLGRRLAAAARALAPPGETVFVQVSPGNVASLRAVLAAGYTPVGAEVLFPLR